MPPRRAPRYRHYVSRAQVNRYRSRYRQRSARFRRHRQNRRRARAPSRRNLARQIRAVKKRMISAKKYYYTVAENVLVENNLNFVKLGLNGAYDGCLVNIPNKNAINPNTGIAFEDYQAREDDSMKSCVSSISGRISVHCSGPVESTTTEHYWIALVKVKVDVGSGNITVPQPSQVWDPSDTFIPGNNSLLPLWRMFMPNIQFPEIGGKLFKVVKLWTGTLQPQEGPVMLTTDYTELALENNAVGTDNAFAPSQPGGDPYTNTVPGAGTHGYASTIPSYKQMNFTQNMKNKIIEFDAINDREAQNEKWYLLALGNNPLGSRQGYRVNATIRTTFYDT